MDFHTLSRRELQTLCKKNKIPANITNVAMADALSALPQVEGLDEILNPKEGDFGTPAVQPRTAGRASTQRKPVKETGSTKVATRVNRGAIAGVAEGEGEQENKDANVPVTPAAVPSSRRRVPAVYTRRKKEVIEIEDGVDDKNEVQGKPVDVAKTPAVAPASRSRAASRSVRNKSEIPDGTSVQKAYSTRRSVRLLGSSLSKMSLLETEDMKQNSVDAEKGTSLQTESTVVSQNTDEVEVSSVNKATCERQAHVSGPEVKSSDIEVVLQEEPEEKGSEEAYVEAAQEDLGLNLRDSFETCADSYGAGSEQPEIEVSCDSDEIETKESFGSEKDQAVVFAESEEASTEVAEPNDASLEVSDQTIAPLSVAEPDDASVDVPDEEDRVDLSVEVSEEASKYTADQAIVGLSVEASEEFPEEIAHQAIAPLNVAIPDDACVDDANQYVANMSVMVSDEASKESADEATATSTVVVPNGAMEISSEEPHVEEVMETNPEHSEQSFAETEKLEGSVSAIQAEEDEMSGDFGAEKEEDQKVISEKLVDKVIEQLSMLDVAVKEEDQKVTSESIESGTGKDMKENLKTTDVKNASLRVLKKLLKQKLDGKTNKADNDHVQMEGVEKKRTALQALPQNQLAE